MSGVGIFAVTLVFFAALAALIVLILRSLFSQWRRFRLHLSTAIILMFATGGLMWANTIPHGATITAWDPTSQDYYQAPIVQYGWPFEAHTQYPVFKGQTEGFQQINPLAILNIGVAFGILYLVWHICEWQIQRSGKKLLDAMAGAETVKLSTDEIMAHTRDG